MFGNQLFDLHLSVFLPNSFELWWLFLAWTAFRCQIAMQTVPEPFINSSRRYLEPLYYPFSAQFIKYSRSFPFFHELCILEICLENVHPAFSIRLDCTVALYFLIRSWSEIVHSFVFFKNTVSFHDLIFSFNC